MTGIDVVVEQEEVLLLHALRYQASFMKPKTFFVFNEIESAMTKAEHWVAFRTSHLGERLETMLEIKTERSKRKLQTKNEKKNRNTMVTSDFCCKG
jgi:hypothetical protein